MQTERLCFKIPLQEVRQISPYVLNPYARLTLLLTNQIGEYRVEENLLYKYKCERLRSDGKV